MRCLVEVIALRVAARSRLLERGVAVGEIRPTTPVGAWDGGFPPGVDPARGDYAGFANFCDRDGTADGAEARA